MKSDFFHADENNFIALFLIGYVSKSIMKNNFNTIHMLRIVNSKITRNRNLRPILPLLRNRKGKKVDKIGNSEK